MVGPDQASPAQGAVSKTDSPKSSKRSCAAGNPALFNRRDLQWKLVQAHYGAAAGAFMWGLEALINSERQIRAILTGGWGSGDERKALADLDAFDAAHGTALAA